MNKTALKNAIKDYDTRALLFAAGGLAVNLGFSAFYAVLCVIDGAKWYVTLLSYFVILATARAIVLGYSLKGKFRSRSATTYEEKRRAFLLCGILIIILSLVVAEEIVVMTDANVRRSPRYFGSLVYVNGAYIVAKLLFSIYNTVKNIRNVKERDNPLIASGKFLSFCDSLTSAVILQNAVLAEIDAEQTTVCAVLLAGGVFVRTLMFAMGVYIIVTAVRLKNKTKKEQA